MEVVLNALPKRIPFVTRKIIHLPFTKATLGTMTKIDWFFKRHIVKISRRVGHQAGTQFPVLLFKANKRSQIPLALLPSLSPSRKSCPSVLKWIRLHYPVSFKLPQDSCAFHCMSCKFPFPWWLYCQHHHLESFPSHHPWLYKLLLALPTSESKGVPTDHWLLPVLTKIAHVLSRLFILSLTQFKIISLATNK